jgi:hypothetical protein
MQPMEHEYKFHTVLITCRPTLEPFGFAPQIHIANNDLGVVKTFKFTQRFHTRSEAETYALYVAKKWIDDDKPGATEA